MASSKALQQEIASLLLYQSVFSDPIGQAFLNLLETLQSPKTNPLSCLKAYGKWFQLLAAREQSWQDYLIQQILEDDNPFSQLVQKRTLPDLPPALLAATKEDLQALQSVYNCSGQQLSLWVKEVAASAKQPVTWQGRNETKTCLHQQENWTDSLTELASYYRQYGTGLLGKYRALNWQQDNLVGIANPDPTNLNSLVGYESQKEALLKNTEFLLNGYNALHVLLYGSRGSGKSSLVKGLLQKYGDRGLRLVEVSKSQLQDLSLIVEKLRPLPQKFIIFVDDLSFEEDDDAFKALKVVLEGSVTARANNVAVYATSNRRHLIREFFADRPRPRDNDEVHAWDTMQEKLSFSDRFGLTLTFEPANQDTYLTIVNHLAKQAAIKLSSEELEYHAKQWATRHNGRSGRTARQFIDFLQADLATG
ncbi:MAG: ATP-binding protein [Spirulinaceae cyanobacterium]